MQLNIDIANTLTDISVPVPLFSFFTPLLSLILIIATRTRSYTFSFSRCFQSFIFHSLVFFVCHSLIFSFAIRSLFCLPFARFFRLPFARFFVCHSLVFSFAIRVCFAFARHLSVRTALRRRVRDTYSTHNGWLRLRMPLCPADKETKLRTRTAGSEDVF